jgi:hypothetical protein
MSAPVASDTRKPVQREQRDQRVLERRAEASRDQQCAELVAVQGNGMGLVVDSRPPDMRGGRVVQELFLGGVLGEPGDGGQPAGNGGPGPAHHFQLSGEPFDVRAADGEQGHRPGPAPAGELDRSRA